MNISELTEIVRGLAGPVGELVVAEVNKAITPIRDELSNRLTALEEFPQDTVVMGGPPGERGERGEKGIDGINGKDGSVGHPGRDGVDGQDGRDGLDGKDGAPGKDGERGPPGDIAFAPEVLARDVALSVKLLHEAPPLAVQNMVQPVFISPPPAALDKPKKFRFERDASNRIVAAHEEAAE